jgi:hypothetical protein
MSSRDPWPEAENQLVRARARIATQLALVQRLRVREWDTTTAVALLDVLLATYDLMEDYAETLWPEHLLQEARDSAGREARSPPTPSHERKSGTRSQSLTF